MSPTITPEPATANVTGVALLIYARRYAEAANRLTPSDVGFDPVPLHLYCQSLELYLKAFIWLKDRVGGKTIKNKYRHDLLKLWRHSKARGISQHAKVTPLRESVLVLVSPYYERRSFAYLDLDMIATGYAQLKAEPRIGSTLRRLVLQLEKSLRYPVLSAA